MSEIVAFIKARLDEDERAAHAAERKDRELREVYGKRAILDLCTDTQDDIAEEVLFALACIWSDHPDFRDAWGI